MTSCDLYKESGVDIEAGNEAVSRIKKVARRTERPEVLSGIGGFSAAFALNKHKYDEPILISGTDGVGTKLKIAFAMDKHDTIGIDAVAMCVNDVIVQGAEPLYFLDYLACDKVIPSKIEAIIKGVAQGCTEAGCALIGGETAEMPGMYLPNEYDIAGFAVGIVDKKKIIDGRQIHSGDAVIGLASSGLHSNGFSLVRHLLLEKRGYKLHEKIDGFCEVLGDLLLTPTKIYAKTIHETLKEIPIKGMAHITGGGFLENIPRILPPGLNVEIHLGSWPILPVFAFLKDQGHISQEVLFRTFNMGIGYVLIVERETAGDLLALAQKFGEQAYPIGVVTHGNGSVILV